jgi:hypothetical protein
MKVRILAGLAMLAGLVSVSTASASATSFGSPPAAPVGVVFDGLCAGLNAAGGLPPLSGQPPVTKTVLRSDNANSSSDFQVTLTGAIPAQFTTTNAIDCLWIDTNGDGLLNLPAEAIKGYTVGGLAISGSGSTRTAVFEVNVPGAAGKSVCDRAYGTSLAATSSVFGSGSALISGQWLGYYSPKVCTPSGPPAVVPEVPVPALLGVTAALTGLAVIKSRRRQTALPFA